MLSDRLRRFLSSETAVDEATGGGGDLTAVLANAPREALISRIRRLEAALRIECLAREEAEAKAEVHRRTAIKLLQQIQQQPFK